MPGTWQGQQRPSCSGKKPEPEEVTPEADPASSCLGLDHTENSTQVSRTGISSQVTELRAECSGQGAEKHQAEDGSAWKWCQAGEVALGPGEASANPDALPTFQTPWRPRGEVGNTEPPGPLPHPAARNEPGAQSLLEPYSVWGDCNVEASRTPHLMAPSKPV